MVDAVPTKETPLPSSRYDISYRECGGFAKFSFLGRSSASSSNFDALTRGYTQTNHGSISDALTKGHTHIHDSLLSRVHVLTKGYAHKRSLPLQTQPCPARGDTNQDIRLNELAQNHDPHQQ